MMRNEAAAIEQAAAVVELLRSPEMERARSKCLKDALERSMKGRGDKKVTGEAVYEHTCWATRVRLLTPIWFWERVVCAFCSSVFLLRHVLDITPSFSSRWQGKASGCLAVKVVTSRRCATYGSYRLVVPTNVANVVQLPR